MLELSYNMGSKSQFGIIEYCKCTVNQGFILSLFLFLFFFLFFFKEAPVFTELSRENDEEKGSFTFFFF